MIENNYSIFTYVYYSLIFTVYIYNIYIFKLLFNIYFVIKNLFIWLFVHILKIFNNNYNIIIIAVNLFTCTFCTLMICPMPPLLPLFEPFRASGLGRGFQCSVPAVETQMPRYHRPLFCVFINFSPIMR